MGLYYEAHVTIEPVFDERLHLFRETAERYGFRVADLLLQKRKSDKPERSKRDSFCTARSNDFDKLKSWTECLMVDLKGLGFQVWRWKIEDTLIDVRLRNG